MNRIAVLMTCHNRREKTLRCLASLRDNTEAQRHGDWDVFLVDDGCTDGTGEEVASRKFLVSSGGNVHLIQGSGKDFWARGMARAWCAALEYEKEQNNCSPSPWSFTSFLWLNDDVELFPDAFQSLVPIP